MARLDDPSGHPGVPLPLRLWRLSESKTSAEGVSCCTMRIICTSILCYCVAFCALGMCICLSVNKRLPCLKGAAQKLKPYDVWNIYLKHANTNCINWSIYSLTWSPPVLNISTIFSEEEAGCSRGPCWGPAGGPCTVLQQLLGLSLHRIRIPLSEEAWGPSWRPAGGPGLVL